MLEREVVEVAILNSIAGLVIAEMKTLGIAWNLTGEDVYRIVADITDAYMNAQAEDEHQDD